MTRPAPHQNRRAQSYREIEQERARIRATLNPYLPTKHDRLPASAQFFGLDHVHAPEPRPQTPAELWQQVFEEERATLESTTKSRTKVAWRFLREVLRLLRHEAAQEPLESLTPTPDHNPWRLAHPIEHAPREPGTHRAWRLEHALAEYPRPGLTLLPPPPTTPDPLSDAYLLGYARAIEAAAEDFGYADQDPAGTAGLTNPEFLRLSFPTPVELYRYEEELVREFAFGDPDTHTRSLNQRVYGMLDRDANYCYHRFRTTHKLEEAEIGLLHQLACRMIGRRYDAPNPLERRAIAVGQCDAKASVAADFDPRTEMQYRKASFVAAGISRIEPERPDDDMLEAMRRIATRPIPVRTTAPAALPHDPTDTTP